jgi:hypothetical protein
LPKTLGAADAHVLAGDDGAADVALALAVEVLAHHQRHDLAVGADVRSGDVDVRADEALQLVHEAQGDGLQLLLAVLAGIDLDAALAAAEGNLGDRGLPGHLRGERLEQVERHLAVVADAALVRAAGLVVLHAVGLEALRLTGDELVDAAVREPEVAAANHHVRAEERLAVEQDLSVRQPLEPVGVADLCDRKVSERAGSLGRQRAQPVLQLRGDVEDVLVVGLLELEPHPRRETDRVGRAMEDLHRVRVESALGGRVRDPHEVLWLGHGVWLAPRVPRGYTTRRSAPSISRRPCGKDHVARICALRCTRG